MIGREYARQPYVREGGAVLVEVALLVFGILAVAALTIDLGLAFLAQDQMQTATDSASLEGVRWQDEVIDEDRRVIVAAMLGVTFDDDLAPDPVDRDPYGFGAGPIIPLVGGSPGINAGAIIDLSGPRVYKPNAEGIPLQINLDNLVHGDMVSGSFSGDPLVSHAEAADYSRDDFAPAAGGEAFLVRMRRTNDLLGLDQDSGISSSGPTLPLLFGLGAAISSREGSDYNIRTDGVTVRSTSIASRKRALRVAVPGGLSVDQHATLGTLPLAPVAIRSSVWETLAVGVATDLAVDQYIIAIELEPSEDTGDRVDFVGESVQPAGLSAAFGGGDAIVPVIADPIGDGVLRVLAFGIVVLPPLPGGAPPTNLNVTKRGGRLPRSGTTAKDSAALLALAAYPQLFTAHATMSEPVLAAVLVR